MGENGKIIFKEFSEEVIFALFFLAGSFLFSLFALLFLFHCVLKCFLFFISNLFRGLWSLGSKEELCSA